MMVRYKCHQSASITNKFPYIFPQSFLGDKAAKAKSLNTLHKRIQSFSWAFPFQPSDHQSCNFHSLNLKYLIDIYKNLKMQQLFQIGPIKWYFALGAPEKSSLATQFCRQNNYKYLNNPSQNDLIKCESHAIIQGPLQLFHLIQKHNPELNIIYFGSDYSNAELNKIRKQYQSIGRCRDVVQLDHSSCRKALYPNLIFIYGPVAQQNEAAARTLAANIQYRYSQLPTDPNHLIQNSDKTKNYIVNGLFTNPNHISILEQYFNIRIIHFAYSREDLPKQAAYFDVEQDLSQFLKGKKYYIRVKGDQQPIKVMDEVGVGLCPRLIFINDTQHVGSKLITDYLDQNDGLLLDIEQIQHIRNRKRLPQLHNQHDRIRLLTQILYQSLSLKQIFFTHFPKQTYEFVEFQNLNRKFTHFVDFTKQSQYKYSEQFSSQIYFLEQQKIIRPSFDLPLKQQLENQIQYWVVNGAGTCGKTSISKYISSQFGYKLIQFESEAAAAKQKIASPQDGDEVPVKKYVAYFANVIKNNPQNTYILDSLPYTGSDLQLWVKQIGCPNVINLKAEPHQLIRRMRKKAQGDLTAQISEQETAKVTESIAKNNQWIEKLAQYGPSSKIYQVDYSLPQIFAQTFIDSILRPRIFLAQRNNHLLYQNIAIKYNMGFVNLRNVHLANSAEAIRKCGKRDVIVCNYGHHHGKNQNHQSRGVQQSNSLHEMHYQKLVSQDLYWIEKHLGEIRYLGIWEPQPIQIKEKLMKLEKPPQPVKPKPAEGQQQKQQQPPAQDQEGKPKKVFDIYQYQWTQPQSHKNLSQWYFKLKKKVIKRTNNQHTCFQKFQEILDALNSDKQSNFYEIINQ